jgi:hypothetical protein
VKVGDLVIYAKSFYEHHGYSAEEVFETCGFGLIKEVNNRWPEPECLYVVWSRGHDCWEYPDELEVISESR